MKREVWVWLVLEIIFPAFVCLFVCLSVEKMENVYIRLYVSVNTNKTSKSLLKIALYCRQGKAKKHNKKKRAIASIVCLFVHLHLSHMC